MATASLHCPYCDTLFTPKRRGQRFCSEPCREGMKVYDRPPPPDKTCTRCGSTFTPYAKHQTTCCCKDGSAKLTRDEMRELLLVPADWQVWVEELEQEYAFRDATAKVRELISLEDEEPLDPDDGEEWGEGEADEEREPYPWEDDWDPFEHG